MTWRTIEPVTTSLAGAHGHDMGYAEAKKSKAPVVSVASTLGARRSSGPLSRYWSHDNDFESERLQLELNRTMHARLESERRIQLQSQRMMSNRSRNAAAAG